jgi:undecaprenyl-diphosphatase
LATVLAVIVYFYKDLWKLVVTFFNLILKKPVEQKDKNLLLAIIIGTIPAIIIGVLLEGYMDTIFRNAKLVALVLILGSVVFYFAEKFAKQSHDLTVKKGFLIGLFQCLALVPGFSRSGATISGGLFLGLNRGEAARFSFLLSIPIILGSGLKKLFDIFQSGNLNSVGLDLIVGSVVAFIVGLFVIHFLIKYLKNHSLNVFGLYRIILALIILLFI